MRFSDVFMAYDKCRFCGALIHPRRESVAGYCSTECRDFETYYRRRLSELDSSPTVAQPSSS